MYQAIVLYVMIAAPSDVTEPIDIAEDMIHQWNAEHSERERVVLLPISWRSHAYPAAGAAPQKLINRQVVERSDLLVAIFAERLGSRTDGFDSGTVEEIESHISFKKPVMIYFSEAKIERSTDRKQLQALESFKKRIQKTVLTGSYGSNDEFRESFRRDLNSQARNLAKSTAEDLAPYQINIGSELEEEAVHLSPEAEKLLLSATIDRTGSINLFWSLSGYDVTTNGMEFAIANTAEDRARWREAVIELAKAGMIDGAKDTSPNMVTTAGFEYVKSNRDAIKVRTRHV